MESIQEIFDRIQEKKREQKEIKDAYKDALENTEGYKEVVDQIKRLKEKKASIEKGIKSQSKKDFDKLDVLKVDIRSDQMLLADLAMTKMMKGEEVGITDAWNNSYQPEFSVKFRKVG